MNSSNELRAPEDSLDIGHLFGVLWRGRWLLVAGVILFLGLGGAYCLMAQRWYKAEVLLKLADFKSNSQEGDMGGLGGLAGLAGISVGTDPSAEPIAVLTSREFTSAFIQDQHLLPILFASEWDKSANRWKKTDLRDQPDVRDGVKYFDKQIRAVAGDKKTNLIKMTIEWKDPATAAAWANMLVDRANDLMRTRALTEAQNKVNYLKQELAVANVVPLQQSIGRVLENELQKLMLASVNKDYAFKFIDHAGPPKWSSRPKFVLVIAGSMFFGIIFPMAFLIGRDVLKGSRVQSPAKP